MNDGPTWAPERPQTLVVACSDGRLQAPTDHYLRGRGITEYDRLYLPGGPGALAGNWREMLRAARHVQELRFLLEVHDVRRVILLFHGAAPGGPPEAECADYRRAMPHARPEDLVAAQLRDAADVARRGLEGFAIEVELVRAEVMPDLHVRFVEHPQPG